MTYILFDIGGTNTRVTLGRENSIGDVRKFKTPQNPEEAVAALLQASRELLGDSPLTGAAGGIRDRVINGIFLQSKMLPAWEGFPIEQKLSQALGVPVSLIHDTAAAGLGEVHVGAGKGSAICAYITVSTGVGGDRIVDGTLDRSTFNPEIGRQKIGSTDLEDLISGTAVRKKWGIEPRDLSDIAAREELADFLAQGLYNTTLHWSPDTIVLGGSMIVGVNPIPLERVVATLSSLITMYPSAPQVRMATLGDNGGLWGALAYIEKRNRINPTQS
jgi:predicted NBD/HSP70 family sugar kinase